RLRERGISSLLVLRALETVPRELFVPHRYSDLAWRDMALPAACGQTMPSPDVLARMLAALDIAPAHNILEIGTGSGYCAAVMSRIAAQVTTFERSLPLFQEADGRLRRLGFENIRRFWGDGADTTALAALEAASFDRIVIHAAVEAVPGALMQCLSAGGSLVYARRKGEGDFAPGIYLAQPGPGGVGAERWIASAHFTPLGSGTSAVAAL
ncbi:MAG: protein-L-isoaspartate O-methyltransferase, partial [Alphaproteobacteria bacterium]|nr:protein-L-isoaspartate O-methyltransferase [Alphaproteobacteria bacterium]